MTPHHHSREVLTDPIFRNALLGNNCVNKLPFSWDSEQIALSRMEQSAVGSILNLEKPKWILVIEDNPSDFMLLQMSVGPDTLSRLRHLPDGEQALTLLHELAGAGSASLPDVIILDLNLPRVDGHQVIQEVRSEKALNEIAILVLTSSSSPVERRRALSEGADLYWTKPIDLEAYNSLPNMIEETRQNRDLRIQHVN